MATYPHVRVVAEGTLGDGPGNEIWSCGLKVVIQAAGGAGGPIAPTQADVDSLADGARTAWGAMIISYNDLTGQGTFSAWTRLVAVKASAVTSNGRNDPAIKPAIALADASDRGVAGAQAGDFQKYVPYQVSIVATLRGGTYDRGSAGLGRIYLPCPNVNDGGGMIDGLIRPQAAQGFADSVAGLISAINAGGTVANGHKTTVSNIGQSENEAGLRFQYVSQVTCDNRPDTIRRRYSALSGIGKMSADVAIL